MCAITHPLPFALSVFAFFFLPRRFFYPSLHLWERSFSLCAYVPKITIREQFVLIFAIQKLAFSPLLRLLYVCTCKAIQTIKLQFALTCKLVSYAQYGNICCDCGVMKSKFRPSFNSFSTWSFHHTADQTLQWNAYFGRQMGKNPVMEMDLCVSRPPKTFLIDPSYTLPPFFTGSTEISPVQNHSV